MDCVPAPSSSLVIFAGWIRRNRPIIIAFFIAAAFLTPARADGPTSASRFVGSMACAAGHAKENAAWQGSRHRAAMRVADAKTMLGNFNGARFSYAGVTSTFTKRDGRFLVRTDGPDGKLHDYEARYTFGVERGNEVEARRYMEQLRVVAAGL